MLHRTLFRKDRVQDFQEESAPTSKGFSKSERTELIQDVQSNAFMVCLVVIKSAKLLACNF